MKLRNIFMKIITMSIIITTGTKQRRGLRPWRGSFRPSVLLPHSALRWIFVGGSTIGKSEYFRKYYFKKWVLLKIFSRWRPRSMVKIFKFRKVSTFRKYFLKCEYFWKFPKYEILFVVCETGGLFYAQDPMTPFRFAMGIARMNI